MASRKLNYSRKVGMNYKCSRCRKQLPMERFSPQPRSKGPRCLSYWCKACVTRSGRLRRKKNPKMFRERERLWREKNRTRLKERYDPAKRRKYNRAMIEKYPGKYRARYKSRYLTPGRRKNCQSCRKPHKLEKHHTDYRKPMSVIWLCYPCHVKHHTKMGTSIE